MKHLRVGLAGNPNAGKTSIFNSLTGLHQKVGNYAGVTVEKKSGRTVRGDYSFEIFDLPGTYSLTSYSIDEVVTRDFILNEKPDVIIDVLDATNLERNLYLCLQFLELQVPLVGALNIIDQAEKMGLVIDEKRLSLLLEFPIIRTVGSIGTGLDALLDAVVAAYNNNEKIPTSRPYYGLPVESVVTRIEHFLQSDADFEKKNPCRWLATKLVEKDRIAAMRIEEHSNFQKLDAVVAEGIKDIEQVYGRDAEIVVSEQRYAWIHGAVQETVIRNVSGKTSTQMIDHVLLNRFFGLPIFLGVLWVMFQATFFLGAYPQNWLENFFSWASETLRFVIPEGIVQSLVVDGIVAGVGGVFSFVPLVIILFLCISILEDSGYMSRAAFIMDKFLHVFGLHGQSFLPMMLGFGCSVPAIMATRALKNPRDRIITILVIPFMSCGAKLPVYVLLAGTFFAGNAGTVVLVMYIVGMALAMFSALLFRKTVLRGPSTPFVMELPPYRLPSWSGVARHVSDKTVQYLRKAGTVILAASILIWAITTFPQLPTTHNTPSAPQDALSYSIAGRIGTTIEPLVAPMGFDWKIAIATVTGFAAKELVVSTMGILYSVGENSEQESESLRVVLQKDPNFSPLVAISMMLFTLVLAPCFAAQATIKAELGWKWLGAYVVYSVVAAWVLCTLVFQFGRVLGIGV